MSKLKGLLLTEGLHGMISQVEGLAKALDLDYFHEQIELNSPWLNDGCINLAKWIFPAREAVSYTHLTLPTILLV